MTFHCQAAYNIGVGNFCRRANRNVNGIVRVLQKLFICTKREKESKGHRKILNSNCIIKTSTLKLFVSSSKLKEKTIIIKIFLSI